MSDIEHEVPLGDLDPGRWDAAYWPRFHARVMDAARSGLEARRLVELTVGDVVLSWGRLVVPMAVVAAAIAALLVLQPGRREAPGVVAGLEEVLSSPRDGEEPLPAFLYTDQIVDRNVVLFAVEGR